MDCRRNRELLLQVWTNILGNAVKFTPIGGSISVSMNEASDFIEVIISDTGIGMTKEVRTHIFEKFYQAEESRHGEAAALAWRLQRKL